jgi:peptide/nickel transport system substrate-binding protein
LPPHPSRSLVVTLLIAAAGVCAPGCGRKITAPPPAATMRIGIGTPPQGTRGMGSSALVSILTADPWLTNKADGHPGERVATSWAWDPDGLSLHLRLRSGVLFHDGTPLTPEIAAQALRASVAAGAALSLTNATVASIEPEDGNAVVIHLKEPNSFVLSELTGVTVTLPGHPDIGTGAFKIAGREGNTNRLVAFPQYYRGRPALAGIDVTNYPTQRNAWTALMRGDIDMLYEVSRDAADFVQAESTIRSYSFLRPYYIPLGFNVRRAMFKDARVRQAINLALDKPAIVRDGMKDRGTVADGPVFPQHWAYVPPPRSFFYDPAAARQLLDRAGFPLRASAPGAVPIRFTFKCLVFADDPRFERLEVILQKQLADVGIEMQLVPLKLKELAGRLTSGDFDAYVFEGAGRSLAWVYEFYRSHPGMPLNSGYQAADAILDQLKAARSDGEAKAAVADLARLFYDDPPAAFLAWQEQTRAVSRKFDVGPDDKRDILANLWQTRPAGAQ